MKLICVPAFNSPGRPRGCELAPAMIVECLKKDMYSSERGRNIRIDAEIVPCDLSHLAEMQQRIFEKSREVFSSDERVFFLGGDHSLSYPTVKGFLEHYPEGKLIIFDAHPDCMPSMKEATHEEWLRKLIEEGFSGGNILLAGLRNSDPEELRFIEEQGIRTVSINALLTDLEVTTDMIMEFSQGQPLYVSLDIDIVDPAFASGTGYKEPGGLSSRAFLYIVQRIAMMKHLKGGDLVEINPLLDDSYEIEGKKYPGSTVKLGARILAELSA